MKENEPDTTDRNEGGMRRKKILVVDDSPHIRNGLAFRLKGEGYLVVTAENGKECVKKVKEECPDLILLDIKMPILDGYQTLAVLNEEWAYPDASEGSKNIPVIMMSAHGRDYHVEQAVDEGAVDYIVKPFA